uniref:non-specific serine/threonine protein kinase n=1 Tax=Helianthus annuus TaxID=4232 RepID=A0A251TEI0_HELAN
MSSFDNKFNHLKIPLIDIKTATNNFADENIIRQGRHRKIYKGQLLRSEKLINIVALCFDSKSWRGRKEFMTEIVMLCSLKHQNLASTVGFCEEDDEKIIISKFEANGSLDQYLSDPVTLTWTRRLQSRSVLVLIHTNVKSSKILLDDNWEPKLSGFELSKMQPVARRQGIVLDRLVSGTGAYVDPAFVKSGGVTHKSDVYSLGVVLFEVLCGRKAFVQTSKHVEPEETVPPTFSDVYDYFIRESMTHIQARKHEWVPGSFSRMDTASFAQMQPPSFPPSIGVMKPPSIGAMNPPSWGEIQNVMQPLSFLAVAEKPPSIGYVRGSYNFSEEEKYMITMKSLEHLHMPEDGLLAKLAKSHYENKTLDDIIHPDLRKQMNDLSLNKFTEAAYFCLKEKRAQRPNIDRVIYALNKALALQLHHENSLVLSEHSTVEVEGTTINHWKGGNLEHLKIELDAIESAKKCLIGKGGYGSVYKTEIDSTVIPLYKAELPKRSITVAIKDIIYREDKQGEQGFFAELEILSGCRHPNIVTLLGFCYEPPRMILVYEYVSNGSLEDYLGSEAKMTNLTWVQRLKICIDIACGLNYIHSTIDNKQKIIHRDIKSANVLLGENWEAKIADFGLSIFHPLNHLESTIQATKIAGTNTYLDPEYESTGKLKKASDVYSFGVVLFEILTGRFAFEWVTKDNERGLAPVVQQLFKSKGTLKEMVDPKLREESDGKGYTLSRGPNKDSLHIFSKIGCLCLSEKQDQRPTMEVVIKELKKALEFQEYHTDGLRVSLEDIKRATQDFKIPIGKGGFGTVYRGENFHGKELTVGALVSVLCLYSVCM